LDYKLIEALESVIEQKGFEKAAESLFISQSAVSQRIKQLEKILSQPVLIRTSPPVATPAGKKLLGLLKRVRVLESELLPELNLDQTNKPLPISIATNADSLATWFLPTLSELLRAQRVELNLIIDDEGRTIDKLKSGEVVGAISLQSHPLAGCQADFVGEMEYLCVATPDFIDKCFPNGITRTAFSEAPEIAFGLNDDMNERFTRKHFEGIEKNNIKHLVQSSEACVNMVKEGVGYCLIPRIQIQDLLARGDVVELVPGKTIINRIYWHHWSLESGLLKEISHAILVKSKPYLY
jgi:LysR family transcriptional regulator (chromosome initiation inhibitor)